MGVEGTTKPMTAPPVCESEIVKLDPNFPVGDI